MGRLLGTPGPNGEKNLKENFGKSVNKFQLDTILCDTVTVINSRPLNYLSEDPGDLTLLTSSMFLQEIQTVVVLDLDSIDNINLTRRLRYQQRLRNDPRNRSRNEYWSLLVHQEINKAGSKEGRCGAHWLRQQEETRLVYGTGSGGVSRKGQFSQSCKS
ncbi:hypothetical protein TNCV_4489591 [Trichonephila clavipes]|nr:hypothetical protein TNCV_4489591 [Trichonephila clavipes]